MMIDAREIELMDLLLQLKEILAAQCNLEVSIDVVVRNFPDSKKVSTFAAMSGCQTETLETDGCYLVRISGNVCCA